MHRYAGMRYYVSLALLLLAGGGCSFFKSARITEMVPGMSTAMDKVECWLTIEVKKVPGGADPKSLKVRFSSAALAQDEEYDWAYIATHDVIPQGMMKGFKDNGESQPDKPPPFNMPLKVKFPLKARERIQVKADETIKLKAELFWGQEKADSAERTIEHVYRRE